LNVLNPTANANRIHDIAFVGGLGNQMFVLGSAIAPDVNQSANTFLSWSGNIFNMTVTVNRRVAGQNFWTRIQNNLGQESWVRFQITTADGTWTNNGWTNGTAISNHRYNSMAGYRVGRAGTTTEPDFASPFNQWNFNHFGAGNANSSPLTMWIRDPIQPGSSYTVNASSFMTAQNSADTPRFEAHPEGPWAYIPANGTGNISFGNIGVNYGDLRLMTSITINVPEGARRHGFQYLRFTLALRQNNTNDRQLFASQTVYIIFRLPDTRQTISAPSVSINQETGVMSWNSVTNATGYHVYTGGVRQTTNPVTATNFNLTTLGLNPGIHNIQLRAINPSLAFHDSALSAGQNFTVFTTLSAAGNLTISDAGVLSWGAVTRATGYHIYACGERRTAIAVTGVSFNLITLSLDYGIHSVQVRAVSTAVYVFDSILSAAVNFTINRTLASPAGVNINQSSGVVNWNASNHATGYHIYVNGERRTTIAVTVTNFNLTTLSLAPGVHNIQIRAVSSVSYVLDSNLTAGQNFTIFTTLLAPIGLSISETGILTFNASARATGYHIYINGLRHTTSPITTLNFILSSIGLNAGVHSIQVRAVSTAVYVNDSVLSSAVSFMSMHVLTAPQNVIVNQAAGLVSWNAVTNAAGYHIYVNNTRRTTNPVNQTNFNLIPLLLPVGSHNIQIRAVSAAAYLDDSSLSNAAAFIVVGVLPVPLNVSVNADSGVVTWNTVYGATGYHIYVNNTRRTTNPVGQTNFNLTSLSLPIGIHSVQIKAISSAVYFDDSPLSGAASFIVAGTLTTPSGVLYNQNTQILSWNAVGGAAGYLVYVNGTRRTTAMITQTNIHISSLNLSVGVSHLSVRAVNPALYIIDSVLSDVVSVTVNAILSAPQNISINQTSGILSFSAVSLAAGYHIYINNVRATDNPITATSFNITTLSLNIGVNQIQVRAVNPAAYVADSALSTAVSFTRFVTLTSPLISINQSGILSWNAIENASGYYIYAGGVRLGGNMVTALSVNLNSLSLSPGVRNIQVRAVNPASYIHNSVLSNALSFTVSTTLAAPVVSVDEENRVISWNAVAHATGYHVYINSIRVTNNPTAALRINMGQLTLSAGMNFVQVTAINPAVYIHNSDLSERVDFIVGIRLFAPSVTIEGDIINWNSVANADGYFVYVNAARRTSDRISQTSFDLRTLGLGFGIHTVQVRAASDTVYYFDSVLSTARQYLLGTILAAPLNLAVNNNNGTIRWNSVLNATGYQVFVNGIMQTATVSPFVSISSLNLAGGQNSVTIRAVSDRVGFFESVHSVPLIKSVAFDLIAPSVQVQSELNIISWDRVEGASGYAVYVDGARRQVLPAYTTTISINRLGLSEGTHNISVRAIGGAGHQDSVLSNISIVQIIPPPPPIIPPRATMEWWGILLIAGAAVIFMMMLTGLIVILLVIRSINKNRKRKENEAREQAYRQSLAYTTYAGGYPNYGHYTHISPRQQLLYKPMGYGHNNSPHRQQYATPQLPQGSGKNYGHKPHSQRPQTNSPRKQGKNPQNLNMKSPHTQRHPNQNPKKPPQR